MHEGRAYPTAGNAHEVQQPSERLTPTTDLMEYFQQYTRERPEVVALWCLGVGFVLGWKLKPW
jgi:hypothetical protein